MSNMTRRNFVRAFGVAAAGGVLAGCSNNGGGSTDGGSAGVEQSIAVCLATEPDNIDPCFNSAVDGATMIVHMFSGLAKWEKDGEKYVIVPDAAEELVEGVANEDGTVTYTYTLRDGMKWTDGEPVTAQNFAFAWQRAANVATGSDYGYLFEVVKGYSDEDENAQLAVEATDDKTLVVTLNNAVSYWDELTAFPVFFPAREDIVSNEGWATDPSTYVSNGAYKMTGWEHNSVITLEKNPDFIDADQVTMEKIEFYLSDDANNMLTNFTNGTWQLIDDVPTNEIASLKAEYPEEFKVEGQIGTYYVSFNINAQLLPASSTLTGDEAEKANQEVRQAIGLLFDRNYIVNDVAQGGQLPASSFVSMGLTEPDGSEFYKNAGDNDFDGYYNVAEEAVQSNFDEAKEILKKYYTYDEATGLFTDVPSFTYLYNTSEGHKAIGEYLQSACAAVGITLNLENQEWNTFLNTRKSGDFTIARNGWLCDYNDPISMLDMWVSNSGNNDCQFGKGAAADLKIYSIDTTSAGADLKVENGTWAETYDAVISMIKSESDDEKRYKLMHLAEDLLMSTGCISPLYFYTDLFMISQKVQGFFSIPLGYKYFTYATISE